MNLMELGIILFSVIGAGILVFFLLDYNLNLPLNKDEEGNYVLKASKVTIVLLFSIFTLGFYFFLLFLIDDNTWFLLFFVITCLSSLLIITYSVRVKFNRKMTSLSYLSFLPGKQVVYNLSELNRVSTRGLFILLRFKNDKLIIPFYLKGMNNFLHLLREKGRIKGKK